MSHRQPEDQTPILTVIPRVVIHKCRPIGHTRDLVPVVPPAHHDRVLLRVLP